ncbi:MAG TPA: Fe-S oxidoreductase [Gammaproteobacteria bacterium]|nr:Fe-S oxidoreductase [Gammaproteobacteria bacterium]
MSTTGEGYREGSLEAPTRHPIDWKNPAFYDESSLFDEMERVFDICHGCRRCVSLCNSFPTLFDLVDESSTMEVDGVARQDYWKVVDHCYLCDLCYLTKCPYVPPHEWNVDYPHLMLRAKAVKHRKGKEKLRDKVLSSTDQVGQLAGIPVVSGLVNTMNRNKLFRKQLDRFFGVHQNAVLPEFHSDSARKRLANHHSSGTAMPAGRTQGKVALFTTCYGNRNQPDLADDLVAVFEHNGIPVSLVEKERCCGMPKLELGDLEAVDEAKKVNIPAMIKAIDAGYDIVAPIPSCVLMFKQELPLMYPDDADVARVRDHMFDPFEYLMLRDREGLMNTEFPHPLGKVSYHAACHLRVQKIGLKTRDLLKKIPDTEVDVIERCSGHDGTYAVKSEFHDISMKICRPVFNKVKKDQPDHYSSDCPMAGDQIAHGVDDGSSAEHPLRLLRKAYGI